MHAEPVKKLGQTTSSAAGPQSWMTRSSGVVGPQGCPGHSLRFPNDMVEVIDGLLQMLVRSKNDS